MGLVFGTLAPEMTAATSLRKYREIVKCDPCAYCGGPGGVVDHIVARAWPGGLDEWENITAACQPCNAAKHWKSLLTVLLGEHVGPYRSNGRPYRPWLEAWWNAPT